MKKLLVIVAVLLSQVSFSQKVTDSVVIKMDTTTYKYITSLIRENIDSRTATGTNSGSYNYFPVNLASNSGAQNMYVSFQAPSGVTDFTITGTFQYQVQ